jgi:hypothetical protein
MFAGGQTSLSSLDIIKPSSLPHRVTVRPRFRELSLFRALGAGNLEA